MVSRQFVFEFVNVALYGRSTVVVAPDFQRAVVAIGDKNPKDVAWQINELAAIGRLVGLDFFADYDKAPFALPVPKFKIEFRDAVDLIDGLPFSDLIEPAFKLTGQPRHHDEKQSALFEKAEEVIGIL